MTSVAVYGGTMSGWAAAIAAGRAGATVSLIEPTDTLGTMWLTGLGQTDREVNPVAGGHTRWGILSEFEARCGAAAGLSTGTLFPTMEAAKTVFDQMLAEVADKVTVRTGCVLQSVTKDPTNAAITSIRAGGFDFPAKNYVDATDELDLAAMAGCLLRRGRESRAVTGEPTAGTRAPAISTALSYDPLTGQRLPGVHPRPLQTAGDADRRQMAYNMRVIVTKHATRINWADIDVPANPADYRAELALAIAMNYREIPMSIGRPEAGLLPVVNGVQTCDANNGGLVRIGTNWIGQFNDWPTMSWDQRRVRLEAYVRRTLGLFKVICTDAEWLAKRPELVADTKLWGLVPGTFPDSYVAGMSPALYIRECRRLVGQDELKLWSATAPERNDIAEPVSVGNYAHVDGHWMNKYATANGRIAFEGGSGLDNGMEVVTAQMPWGIFKARLSDARNLTVARGVSGTRLGWIVTRIELTYIKHGQVCGLAAGAASMADKFTGDLSYKADLLPALQASSAVIAVPGVAP